MILRPLITENDFKSVIQNGGYCLSKSDEPVEAVAPEDKEADADLMEKEKKTKARLRARGPYRKARRLVTLWCKIDPPLFFALFRCGLWWFTQKSFGICE
jgi:hypothetical protein